MKNKSSLPLWRMRKPWHMNIISKAQRYVSKYGGISGASVALGIPRSTIRGWLAKAPMKQKKTAPKITPSKGAWMQSLHHETAHFILDGLPACSGSQNGAKVNAGDRWLVWDNCVRKCLRCIHHAEQ